MTDRNDSRDVACHRMGRYRPGCRGWMAGLMILLFTAGCTTYSTAAADVTRNIERWQRTRVPLHARAAASRPADMNVSNETDNHDENKLTGLPNQRLHGYIVRALKRNPSVQSVTEDVQAKLARIPQATSLPDPVLRTITRPEPIQTAAGDMYFTLGVGQTIPLPAKLDRAGRIAAAELRMAIEHLNATRLNVIADVERAFYQLYLADRSIELTAFNRQLLQDLERVLASQYRVGRIEQQDLLRVQTEVSKLINRDQQLRQQRFSAAAALNQLLDLPPSTRVPLTEVLSPHFVRAEAEDLVELAMQHNPELARLARQVERDHERIALADLGYWPDLTAGVEWTYVDGREVPLPPRDPTTGQRPPVNRKSEAGDDNWALMLQMNIPLWTDRIEAAKRQARHELNRSLAEQRSVHNRIAFRIHDAWTRIQTGQDTIELLETTLIPQARQTYEISQAAYQAGRSDFLTLIDNWRQLLALELMVHREIADLEIVLSELQREVGVQLIRDGLTSSANANEAQP